MEKSNAKKIEMQVESIEEVKFEDVKKSFAGLADREDIQLDPDLMYAKFIMCHEGVNANGDTFTKDVLQRAQYTPRFKPIDWEHGQPFIGTILDSQYGETEEGIGFIEAIGAIWKFHYPDLADSIKAKSSTGGLKLSMECFYRDANYKYGEQIFSQEQADQLGLTDYVGREYMGQKVYRVFSDVIFGGVGVVANPADTNAVFLSVAKKQSEEELALAEFNREQNDFTKKQQTKEVLDAVTIAKFTKAFDKAKSTVVNKFNKQEVTSKDMVLADIKNIVSTLITEIYQIGDDFYKGVASEEEILAMASAEPFEDEQDKEDLEMEDKAKANSIEEVIQEELEVLDEAEATKVEDKKVEDAEAGKPTKKDPDGDGDDDTTPEGDTDHDKFPAKDKKKSKAEEELETTVANLQAELSTKDTALASLQAELDALKSKVEASEKEVKANNRMAELAEAGIEFSEARKSKELEKISAMDDTSFTDYKEFLVEIAGVKKPEVEVAEASVEEEEVEEVVTVENNEVASASLNVELETPKLIKPFGHLAD
jgi:hypothetical protein